MDFQNVKDTIASAWLGEQTNEYLCLATHELFLYTGDIQIVGATPQKQYQIGAIDNSGRD